MKPLLFRGGLSGRVYIVTRYKDLGGGRISATTKYDVTEQYEALKHEDETRLEPSPGPVRLVKSDCACHPSTPLPKK